MIEDKGGNGMGVYINKDTKVIVQGITGSTAAFHTKQMLEYGTKIVAGVTPGKGGEEKKVFRYIIQFLKLLQKQVRTLPLSMFQLRLLRMPF